MTIQTLFVVILFDLFDYCCRVISAIDARTIANVHCAEEDW
jgi:hypothetical protein